MALGALVCLFGENASGQSQGASLVLKQFSARSSSGQFVASARGLQYSAPKVLNVSTNDGFLRLEPGLLAVSAERMKQLLWRELEVQGPWQGKVYLSIRSVRSTNDAVGLTSQKLKDGWHYGLDFPEVIDQRRYVRALTQCILLELANRGSERSAELPPWLIEGLTAQVLASHQTEIVLSGTAPRRNDRGLAATMVNRQRDYPLREAQLRLGTNATFTFQQLSWPGPNDLEENSAYSLNSQVFVAELMRLRGGRPALRNTLFNLPRYYNWQFAFLQAFQEWFTRPLDVEKWWDLTLTHFNGRDPGEAWSVGETWDKLDELLSFPVEVRSNPGELPRTSQVPLQVVIREWERAKRLPLLREKLAQLDLLQPRSAPELRGLVADYREVLNHYLQKFDRLKPDEYARNPPSDSRAAKAAAEACDLLDLRRQSLRPSPLRQASARPAASLPATPGP